MRDTQEAIRRVMAMYPMWSSLFRFFKRTRRYPEVQLANRMMHNYGKELPDTDWDAVASRIYCADRR